MKSKKVTKLADFEIKIDMPSYICRYTRSPEQALEKAEHLVRDVQALFDDHKSIGNLHVYVEKTMENQCSVCGCSWEPDENGILCAACGAEIDESCRADSSLRTHD